MLKGWGGGRLQSLASCSCELPTAQSGEGSCFRSAAQLGSVCVSVCVHVWLWVRARARETCKTGFKSVESVCFCTCNVTTRVLYPLGSGARRIYRAALQRLALHFQTSNFSLSNVVLIKTISPERSPRTQHYKPNSTRKCRLTLFAWLHKTHKLDSVNDNNMCRLRGGKRKVLCSVE